MIGGNTKATIEIKSTTTNKIGESVLTWQPIQKIVGWLDMMSGEARYSYNAKIEESTHMFICDYVKLDEKINSENSRIIIKNKIYAVTFIDNPMELNEHLEIYLKFIGG